MKKHDMWKIRRMIDNRYYHLNESFEQDENGKIKETWKLFEKHDFWLTDGNKAIMTSETHTYEDLYKFVKKNRTIDLDQVLASSTMIILIVTLTLSILNIYLNSLILRGFILGVNILILIFSIIRLEVSERNFKISMKEIKKRIERYKGEK